jgi:catalase
VGAVGDGARLEAAGIPLDGPGVVLGSLPEVITGFTSLLATHRVWERFPATAELVPA